MKRLHILLFMMLLIPMVLGVETKIYTGIDIKVDEIDANNTDLIIIGEDDGKYNDNEVIFRIKFDKADNISITYISKGGEEKVLPKIGTYIDFTIFKEFGNSTDVFDIVNTCNEMANFSNLWHVCVEQRTNFELQIINDMINKSEHEEIETNLTVKLSKVERDYDNCESTKKTEITTLTNRTKELERHRQWGWGGTIIGLGTAGYLLNKYKGWGKRKHQEETEFPKDVSV